MTSDARSASDGLNDFSQSIRWIDHFSDWTCTSGESVQTVAEVGPKFLEQGVQIGHSPWVPEALGEVSKHSLKTGLVRGNRLQVREGVPGVEWPRETDKHRVESVLVVAYGLEDTPRFKIEPSIILLLRGQKGDPEFQIQPLPYLIEPDGPRGHLCGNPRMRRRHRPPQTRAKSLGHFSASISGPAQEDVVRGLRHGVRDATTMTVHPIGQTPQNPGT